MADFISSFKNFQLFTGKKCFQFRNFTYSTDSPVEIGLLKKESSIKEVTLGKKKPNIEPSVEVVTKAASTDEEIKAKDENVQMTHSLEEKPKNKGGRPRKKEVNEDE